MYWVKLKEITIPYSSYSPVPTIMTRCNEQIVTVGVQDTVALWDFVNRTGQILLSDQSLISNVALSLDGRILAAVREEEVQEYDWDDGYRWVKRNVVHVWDTHSYRELWSASGNTEIALSPDGELLASSQAGIVVLYNSWTGRRLRSINCKWLVSRPLCMCFSPNSRLLAIGGWDLWLINISRGWGAERRLAKSEDVSTLRNVVFNPDGSLLAGRCEDGTVRIWDTGSGRELQRSKFPAQFVRDPLAFTPDGSKLAVVAAGGIGGVYFWDIHHTTSNWADSWPPPLHGAVVPAQRAAISQHAGLVTFVHDLVEKVLVEAWRIKYT